MYCSMPTKFVDGVVMYLNGQAWQLSVSSYGTYQFVNMRTGVSSPKSNDLRYLLNYMKGN